MKNLNKGLLLIGVMSLGVSLNTNAKNYEDHKAESNYRYAILEEALKRCGREETEELQKKQEFLAEKIRQKGANPALLAVELEKEREQLAKKRFTRVKGLEMRIAEGELNKYGNDQVRGKHCNCRRAMIVMGMACQDKVGEMPLLARAVSCGDAEMVNELPDHFFDNKNVAQILKGKGLDKKIAFLKETERGQRAWDNFIKTGVEEMADVVQSPADLNQDIEGVLLAMLQDGAQLKRTDLQRIHDMAATRAEQQNGAFANASAFESASALVKICAQRLESLKKADDVAADQARNF